MISGELASFCSTRRSCVASCRILISRIPILIEWKQSYSRNSLPWTCRSSISCLAFGEWRRSDLLSLTDGHPLNIWGSRWGYIAFLNEPTRWWRRTSSSRNTSNRPIRLGRYWSSPDSSPNLSSTKRHRRTWWSSCERSTKCITISNSGLTSHMSISQCSNTRCALASAMEDYRLNSSGIWSIWLTSINTISSITIRLEIWSRRTMGIVKHSPKNFMHSAPIRDLIWCCQVTASNGS